MFVKTLLKKTLPTETSLLSSHHRALNILSFMLMIAFITLPTGAFIAPMGSGDHAAVAQPPRAHPSMTHLAKVPVEMTLRCLNCPLKEISDPQGLIGHEVMFRVELSLKRPSSVPFKLQLNALPQGLKLQAELPTVILTRSQKTQLNFTVLIDEGFTVDHAQRSDETLSLTLSYKSERSGLTKRLTWHPRELLAGSKASQTSPVMNHTQKAQSEILRKLPKTPFLRPKTHP